MLSNGFGARVRPLALSFVAVGAGVALTGCGLLPVPGGGSEAPEPDIEVPDLSLEEENDGGSTEQDTDVFTIQVGDCLNDASVSGEVEEVPTVSCDEPHDSEVYASFDMADGEWPGEAAIDAEAEERCNAEFETFIGVPYMESIYYNSWYSPTEQSWASGDREILCIVYDQSGQVTGSLQGVGE